MKVYISVDLEGISGVTSSEQVLQKEGARLEVRHWVVNEINAAAGAAFDAGAEEVWVNEHHSGKDLLLDLLDPRLVILEGKPKPLMTLHGLDATFSAVFLIGIHAKAGTPQAILDHTWNARIIQAVRVNGHPVGEIGLNALFASHYGVPIALVSGDQAAVEEAKRLLGPVEGAIVKFGLDRYSARLIHPVRAAEILRQAACRAMSSLAQFRPFSLGLPASLEIDLTNTAMAERVCMVPTCARLGPITVSFPCESYLQLMNNLMVATALAKTVLDPVY